MANDQFEQYYTEKLWEMIPSIYRTEDGLADKPGVLRALVQVIASQAAILRRSQDQLWDDQFIDLCNEWAVPYIGDLVATRLLSALNKRGRRIDVAKSIYYRRRKGTPRILEELINDISGWQGKLVEQFEKLGRSRHGLDPPPLPLAGRYSGTLPGGWADLRNQRISELVNGPFEEYFHTPDVRRYNGPSGRYAIPKLAFYLYRLQAFQVIGSTPFSLGDGQRFTFDPSGRDIQLFSKSLRMDNWDEWHSALEWELPTPIPCRLLGHAEYEINEEIILQMTKIGLSTASAEALRLFSDLRFRDESSLLGIIDTFAITLSADDVASLLSFALLPDCGKQALLPNLAYELNENVIQNVVRNVGLTPPSVDALRTLSGLIFKDESTLVSAINTFPVAIKTELLVPATLAALLSLALTPDFGKEQWLANTAVDPESPLNTSSIAVGEKDSIDQVISVEHITAANLSQWNATTAKVLAIDAENGRFKFTNPLASDDAYTAYHYGFSGNIGAGPYERSAPGDPAPDHTMTGGGTIAATDLPDDGITQITDSKTYGTVADKSGIKNMTLRSADYQRPYVRLESNWTLDSGANLKSNLVLDGLWLGALGGTTNLQIIINGDFDCVLIKNCTLDPGGSKNAKSDDLFPLTLSITGSIDTLCIESSIVGPVQLANGGSIRNFSVSDSIVLVIDPTVAALSVGEGTTILQNVTVFGSIDVHRLEASETIITGLARVRDTQTGCFRYSAAPKAVGIRVSRLPRQYECYLFTGNSDYWFNSQRFGDAGFGQLSDDVPDAVGRGAENGSEMGAFSSLLNPIKFDGLKAKIDEYMPFGLIPIYINIT